MLILPLNVLAFSQQHLYQTASILIVGCCAPQLLKNSQTEGSIGVKGELVVRNAYIIIYIIIMYVLYYVVVIDHTRLHSTVCGVAFFVLYT